MRISILTFDAFNDLDSLVAFGMLNRIALLGDKDWQVRIASPTPRVTSMNGLTIDAHEDLSQLAEADAVLVGSGMKTREVANTPALMEQLRALNPERQLLAAQCSGTFLLSRLGLLSGTPACTKPMNSGTAEHEQNGVTIPSEAAITLAAPSVRPASSARVRSGVK